MYVPQNADDALEFLICSLMNARHGIDPIQSAVKLTSNIKETQVLLPRCRNQGVSDRWSKVPVCAMHPREPSGPSGN